jgi:hypothetical protein
LYVTRTTEESFLNISKNNFRKIHFWMKSISEK